MNKQNTIKRIFALLLMIYTLAAVMLSGCAGGNGQTDSTEATNGSNETQISTDATQPQPVEAVQPAPDPNVPMLDLYLSPNGNDGNDGLSEATALLTLDGASKLLVASPFEGNVTVHIAEGEYQVKESAYWHYSNPGYTTYIEGAGQDKTVFIGPMGQDITFLQVSSCNNTSISFKNFTVRLFRNGIIMRCSSDGSVLTDEGVTGWFENLTLTQLGGYYTRCDSSAVAGIQFLGSSNNTVKNCTFSGMRDYSTGNNIHALYISTFSSNNLIQNCLFEDVRPDPVRLRRGSSNNIIEHCTFTNSGIVAYVSDWNAGEAEPEPCLGNQVRYNQFHGGYFGLKIANVCIFKGGTNSPAPLDPEMLLEIDNTVHPSEFNPVVNASVKNYTVKVDGKTLDQKLPVYAMDRYENYINLADMAVLLKDTAFAFTYSTPDAEEETVTTKFTVVLSDGYTGTDFTVQEDAAEGEIQANQARGWSITNLSKSKGAIYERNGQYFVSMDIMQDMLALRDQTIFQYEISGDTLMIQTVFEQVDVPETMLVYMLKLNGSFSTVGSNNGRYSMADMKNFDIVTVNTKDLEHLIRFEDLLRDDVNFAIVGIPIGDGTWGVREWKNSTMKDYYYYGINKLTGLNRAWTDSSNGYANSFFTDKEDIVYYTVIPVGEKLEKDPQYRIAENWTSGSLSNYSEIFIIDADKFTPVGDITKVNVGSKAATVGGTAVTGKVPVCTSALGKNYLNIADMALLLKDTTHSFAYTVNTEGRQISVTTGADSAPKSFSRLSVSSLQVTDWTAWNLQVDGKSHELSAFNYKGNCYVDASAFAEILGIHCNVGKSGIKVLLSLELSDTVDVLMLNFAGNLENRDAADIESHKIDMNTASFTVVSKPTAELSEIIDLTNLMKDDFNYVIVGIELNAGMWGVREWKNNAAVDYYTFADRKFSTGSGGLNDWFCNESEPTVYYLIVPVGSNSESDPVLRIKQDWEKGSPANYTQITFTNTANYTG